MSSLRVQELPGCGALTAAKLLAEIGPIDRFKNDAHSPDTAASHPSKPARAGSQRHRLDRGGNR